MAIINKKELETIVSAYASASSDYTINTSYIYYPLMDHKANEHKLASALVMEHVNAEENKTHTTVLAYTGSDEYYVWCGDKFLTGDIDEDAANERIMLSGAQASSAQNDLVLSSMKTGYSSQAKNNSCNNVRWTANLDGELSKGKSIEEICEAGTNIVCEHIKNMFAQMSDVQSVTRTLTKMHKEALKESATVLSSNKLVNHLMIDSFRGRIIFPYGPGGQGKTFEIDKFAKDNGYEIVIHDCHASDEALDLFGYYAPSSTTAIDVNKVKELEVQLTNLRSAGISEELVSSIAKEGVAKIMANMRPIYKSVLEAAKKAASGKKTILFMDEFTNLPEKEAASLKNSFEPRNGYYYFKDIDTDENGYEKTIEVPVTNLQIVLAANLGSGYVAADIDKAFKQRCMFMHYVATNETIESIAKAKLAKASLDESLASKMISFKKLMEIKFEEGLVPETPTLRHFGVFIDDMIGTGSTLEEAALKEIGQFVELDIDGAPVSEQVEIVEEIIESVFA